MTKHIPYLDGWRGLAIFCLLLGHFYPVKGINFGTVGVALFFVLSGLLMAQVLFIQRTKLAIFYQRRISRVFPSLAIYLLVISLFFLASGKKVALDELLPSMTFTNNYLMPTKDTMPFGHIWSLSVEEHSYIILSLAALWCRTRREARGLSIIALILATIILSIAIYTFTPGQVNTRYYLRTEVASFGIFVSGFIFLALNFTKARLSWAYIAPFALIAGILAHWWSVPVGLRVIIGWGAFALAINAMPIAPRLFIRLFETAWLRRLGLYSFSIYLWQQPYYQFVRHEGMSPWIGLILALLTGIVAYYLIENPARVYLNQRWGRLRIPMAENESAIKVDSSV